MSSNPIERAVEALRAAADEMAMSAPNSLALEVVDDALADLRQYKAVEGRNVASEALAAAASNCYALLLVRKESRP